MERVKKRLKRARALPCLGWREWISLPDLGIPPIKAKVDTGARTSALHATHVELIEGRRSRMVRFRVLPKQGSSKGQCWVEAELVGTRMVRSSVGHVTRRPVISARVGVGEDSWSIRITLIDRDVMNFRMLIGREAVSGRYLIDPGRSYLAGRSKSRR